jgi:hypothetical protein
MTGESKPGKVANEREKGGGERERERWSKKKMLKNSPPCILIKQTGKRKKMKMEKSFVLRRERLCSLPGNMCSSIANKVKEE